MKIYSAHPRAQCPLSQVVNLTGSLFVWVHQSDHKKVSVVLINITLSRTKQAKETERKDEDEVSVIDSCPY